jgi:hypothetical protein
MTHQKEFETRSTKMHVYTTPAPRRALQPGTGDGRTGMLRCVLGERKRCLWPPGALESASALATA